MAVEIIERGQNYTITADSATPRKRRAILTIHDQHVLVAGQAAAETEFRVSRSVFA